MENSVSIEGVLADIQSDHFTNTSQTSYRFSQFAPSTNVHLCINGSTALCWALASSSVP
jgi:hypothetical protein